MSVFSIVCLAVTLLFSLAASWALVLPFFQPESEQINSSQDPVAELMSRKEQLLESIEELEFEFSTSKIAESDYRQARKELTQQAAECVQKLSSFSKQS